MTSYSKKILGLWICSLVVAIFADSAAAGGFFGFNFAAPVLTGIFLLPFRLFGCG
jgi:hypothetical protein